jgi:hypothetical protein
LAADHVTVRNQNKLHQPAAMRRIMSSGVCVLAESASVHQVFPEIAAKELDI